MASSAKSEGYAQRHPLDFAHRSPVVKPATTAPSPPFRPAIIGSKAGSVTRIRYHPSALFLKCI